ncbi:hypothetical protein SAMN05444170_7388 [Bradyrhizobium erythrophlei]|uniref:Uncharacterized protein n=1 Tax=Bradyrhizobium erythrophlei TaxID=1437360 RepID=A0A1M7UXX5_9BRAD|nr:hypothetical protein SAMN05444170_7388 [Bradyrhizobium erythrophlei]
MQIWAIVKKSTRSLRSVVPIAARSVWLLKVFETCVLSYNFAVARLGRYLVFVSGYAIFTRRMKARKLVGYSRITLE